MRKKITIAALYTVFIAVISAFVTTAYFHAFVLNKNEQNPQELLTSVSTDKVTNSIIADGQDIIEFLSYGCHYCASNEENVEKLEKRLPAGKKLVRLHVSYEDQGGLGRYAAVFATLDAMGIEARYRDSAYRAVNKDDIDLGDATQLNGWLKSNNIDTEEYNTVRQSAAVEQKLAYMTQVTRDYKVNATPVFIVSKKWIALQDREFPEFSDQLLSLLNNDSPLEK
ncbi:DsbA family protein [Ewingella americana]|uniref:DsbA family protein n=1 Tax=Ewingella americana TaxID=41202 RepID=UPI0012AD2D09|nr:DsbA family protein [Ewingella americana]MRT04117.1 thioredoxin domain-containing protein [Ewingella americana]